MPKSYDPTSPNPSRVVELLRRLGRRDSAPMPATAEPTGEVDEPGDDSGSGPMPAPERPR